MLEVRFNHDWEELMRAENNRPGSDPLGTYLRTEHDKRMLAKLHQRLPGIPVEELNWTLDGNSLLLITGLNGSGKTTLLQQLYLSMLSTFGPAGWGPGFMNIIEINPEDLKPRTPDGKLISGGGFGGDNWQASYNQMELELITRAADITHSAHYDLLNVEMAYTDLFRITGDAQYVPFYFDSVSMGVPFTTQTRRGGDIGVYQAPRSHRQWQQTATELYLRGIRAKHKGKPILFLFDEPENGLDASSQEHLEQMLKDHFQDERDLGIIVSNSPYLIYSSLPRVDLSAPEPLKVHYEERRVHIF